MSLAPSSLLVFTRLPKTRPAGLESRLASGTTVFSKCCVTFLAFSFKSLSVFDNKTCAHQKSECEDVRPEVFFFEVFYRCVLKLAAIVLFCNSTHMTCL